MHSSYHHPLVLPLWTLSYFGIIVLANMMLLWFEPIFLAGSAIPPAIFASGFVFVLRDFAQREIGHLVLIAIVAAAGTTFWLAVQRSRFLVRRPSSSPK